MRGRLLRARIAPSYGGVVAGAGSLPRRLRGRRAASNKFAARDLLSEAALGIAAQPGRLVLTLLGTVLGIASLVVTVGLSHTAAGQISRRFDAIAATQAVIEPATAAVPNRSVAIGQIPWDVEDRLSRLNGVVRSGAVGTVDIGDLRITAVPINDPSQAPQLPPQVLAATPGLLDSVLGRVVTGRFFDSGHSDRADRVVILGSRAATLLGINRVDRQPAIFIGERAYTVMGIIDDVRRRADLLDAVIMPVGTARADFGFSALEQVQVTIEIGAGPLVSVQAPIALAPNNPESLSVQAPSSGLAVQEQVKADINAIFIALSAVALLVGGLGIANLTLLSVRERTAEIGLRRALGARTGDIGRQFLLESGVVGLLGGIFGATIGVAAVVVASLVRQWTPLMDTWLAVGGALLGGVVGLLAGTYPALKAARIEPITALRSAP